MSAGPAAAPAATEIRRWLERHLETEFGITPEELEAAGELRELGLDSAEALSIVGALEIYLGRALPETLFADFPDVDTLVAQLAHGFAAPEAGALAAQGAAEAGERRHAFAACVNPALGDRLERLSLDQRFVRGEGTTLVDAQGRRALDFVAGYGALPFGHNPAEIWDAVLDVRAGGEPGFCQPSALEPAGELARRLLAVAPAGLTTVAFSNSGAEAIEAAIKLARAATRRGRILATHGGFHGKTLGALSATGNADYQRPFGGPAPGFDHVPYGDAAALERALGRARYAAFLVEPIQGEGGIVEPPPGYLATAKALCQEAGTLLVADEVQTGLGRTGALFASTAAGLAPDLLVLAKALGGGLLPIGATLASDAAYSEDFGLKHSSTFAANTLACRVGLAVLDRLERDGGALLDAVARRGAQLRRGLDALRARHPDLIAEVRGRGLLLGLRFAVDRAGWPWSLLGVAAEQELFTAVMSSYLLNVEGVRFAPALTGSDVLRVEPPLTVSEAECERALEALSNGLAALASRDTSRIFGGILDAAPRPSRAAAPASRPRLARPAAAGAPHFAFLVHPLEPGDYAHFDPTLEGFDAPDIQDVARRLGGLVDPFVVSEVEIVSETGARAAGCFINVTRTAQELAALPHAQALAEIRAAVELAQERGARILGLGAFTSIATRNGHDLAGAPLAVTTGNAYTVVAGVDALELGLAKLERRLEDCTAAVVGATGAIGRGVAMLLAERAPRLVLLGNPARPPEATRRRLLRVAADACLELLRAHAAGHDFAPDSLAAAVVERADARVPADAEACLPWVESLWRDDGRLLLGQAVESLLPLADAVVTATSATTPLVTPESLKRGAIVCDLARPQDVSEKVRDARPDVLVLDGGVVEIPGRPRIGYYGLPEGTAFACMAETMMLALDRCYEDRSIGASIDPSQILDVRARARRHGFGVKRLRGFGRTLGDADFARVRARRAGA